MSLHLESLQQGDTLVAEIHGQDLWKIDALARHRDAIILSRERLESGRLLLTLCKDDAS